jgi:hypothetical protein
MSDGIDGGPATLGAGSKESRENASAAGTLAPLLRRFHYPSHRSSSA